MSRQEATPILSVERIVKSYPVTQGTLGRGGADAIRVVDDVTFDVREGETLGIVGETGCGKSTIARLLIGLLDATGGVVRYRGEDIASLEPRRAKLLRRDLQLVFQDPYSSLNPRKTVGAIIGQPLAVHGVARGRERRRRVQELMEQVGLRPEHVSRYPHEFSGGQRQRVGIARALALQPKVIVADEPVSALDVSVQAQILNLLRRLQRELGLTLVLISHDLSVVRHMSDRVAVMYLGRLVELAPADQLYDAPRHPYTAALLSSVPVPDPHRRHDRRKLLRGDMPSPAHPPAGCRFHPRCPRADARCATEVPQPAATAEDAWASCHHPLEQGTNR